MNIKSIISGLQKIPMDLEVEIRYKDETFDLEFAIDSDNDILVIYPKAQPKPPDNVIKVDFSAKIT